MSIEARSIYKNFGDYRTTTLHAAELDSSSSTMRCSAI